MDDLRAFDETLADDLIANPNDFMPWVNIYCFEYFIHIFGLIVL